MGKILNFQKNFAIPQNKLSVGRMPGTSKPDWRTLTLADREKCITERISSAGWESGYKMIRRREKIRSQEEEDLLKELEQYRDSGCQICLNGKPCRPERVAAACVREDCSYMRDFVSDDQERIRKINFIKIKEKGR